MQDFKREYTADLNIRKGKGWTKSKNKQGEDGSIGSNRSLDRDRGDLNDEDEEDEHADASGKDKDAIGLLNINHYLPPDKDEMAKLTEKEREGIVQRVRARQPAFEAQVRLYHKEEKHARGLVKMGDLMIAKLTEYQSNKASLPVDSDGLYILIEGSVTIKNDFHPADADDQKKLPKYDLIDEWARGKYRAKDAATKMPKNQKAQSNADRPEAMDIFGAEKFLQVQGYAYYGCAYSTAEKEGGTTCGFIRKEQLHLIPFYDLYHLKANLEERYRVKCRKYTEIVKDLYEHALRKINSNENE